MLKQWHCFRRYWIFATPGVLTVTIDSLSFFPQIGGFVSIEMPLCEIMQVTPTAGLLLGYGRVTITTLTQSMTLSIYGDSAETVAKFVQSAVDRVKSQAAELVAETLHVTQSEKSA